MLFSAGRLPYERATLPSSEDASVGSGTIELTLTDSHHPLLKTILRSLISRWADTCIRTWKISPLLSRDGAVTFMLAAPELAELVVGCWPKTFKRASNGSTATAHKSTRRVQGS